ncbi:MAG: outer membrane beta-barrel family protein, partial [Bacteroidota bacterium]
ISQDYQGANGEQVDQFKFSNNQSAIQLETAQVDWEKRLPTGQLLALGVKYAHIQNESQLDFQHQSASGTLTTDPYFSNAYDYDETIAAAYGQWARSDEKWQLQAGLRAEWTQTDGLAGGETGQKLFQRDYWNIFPGLSLGRTINEQNSITFSYNSRIQRPTFQDLNPFVWYADSLTALQGNAELLPERSEVFDLAWQHGKWNVQLSYVHAKNTINTLVESRNQADPTIFTFIRDNLRQMNNATLTLSRGFQVGKYSSYNMFGLRSEHHQFRDEGRLTTNATNGWYLYTSHNFLLPASFKLETSFTYNSRRVDGAYIDNPVYFWHAGISRKFLQDQLLVRLYANDMLDSYRFIGISNVLGNDWTYLSEGDWQFIQLSLHWEIGKMNTNALQERKIGQAELQRM